MSPSILETQIYNQPLPPVLYGDVKDLSVEGRKELRELIGPQPMPFVLSIIINWTWIFTAGFVAVLSESLWVYLLAGIFISSRQIAAAILMHDQVHYNGVRGKVGDLFVNVTCAWPIMLDLNTYGGIHLAHHQHFFSDNDPDAHRKKGPEWQFPMTKKDLTWLFLKDLSGFNAIGALNGKSKSAVPVRPRSLENVRLYRVLFYVTTIGFFILNGQFLNLLALWFLPLATITLARTRLMAICEHAYNLKAPSVIESTPIIEQGLLGKILFPTHNFGYHIYHHLRPGVSYKNLPKVHAIFKREHLVNEDLVFASPLHFLRYMQTRNQ